MSTSFCHVRATTVGVTLLSKSPGVFVNNHLGKEAILAAYDDAIATLEVAVLCETEQAAPEAEPVLVR